MSRKRPTLKDRTGDRIIHWHTCECGKRSYGDKREAKRVARLMHGDHVSSYRCESGGWHVGHLTRAVLQGKDVRPQRAQYAA